MTSPLDQLTGAPQAAPQAEQPLLQKLSAGDVPGLTVPKDFQMPPDLASITLPDIHAAGLEAYKPHDESLALAVFNPKVVTHDQVLEADKAGKLGTFLPSVATFTDAPAAAAPATGAGGAAQVPILPRPAAVGSVAPRNRSLAPTSPSDRAIPGGGALLNGLVNRAH